MKVPAIPTLFLAAVLAIVPAAAQEVVEPPIPQPRPEGLEEPLAAQPLPASGASEPAEGPEFGPPSENEDAGGDNADAARDTEEAAPAPDPGPDPEPERVYQAACPALLTGRVIGEMVPPLSEGTCGLQSPIKLEGLRVNGREVSLSGAPVVNCAMATTLADWAEEADNYAGTVLDTQIESLTTGPGYQCRLRNNADTGFVSEHGLGNAADIMAVNFADGTTISVLDDWNLAPLEPEAKFLGFAHAAACGRFTTVLGPEANSAHENHFHFDLGCHGQTCTAQICE